MYSRSDEAIRDLRRRMADESATLRELEQTFEHPCFKGRAQRALGDCEEAEIMFLRPIERGTWGDLREETDAIGFADRLFQMAVSQRKQLQEILQQYGATVVAIPYNA